MNIPTIKQLVSNDGGGGVYFDRFEDRKLWHFVHYQNEIAERIRFDFPIPVEDTDGGVFYAKDDRRIYYMRWMRKHIEFLKEAQDAARAAKGTP